MCPVTPCFDTCGADALCRVSQFGAAYTVSCCADPVNEYLSNSKANGYRTCQPLTVCANSPPLIEPTLTSDRKCCLLCGLGMNTDFVTQVLMDVQLAMGLTA